MLTTDVYINSSRELELSNKHGIRVSRALTKVVLEPLCRPDDVNRYFQIAPFLTHLISHRHSL